jgi:hypothetical protein
MICPECQSQIAEGKKFCGKCGTELREKTPETVFALPQLTCPRCGSPVSAAKKFCGACGGSVTPPPVPKAVALPATSPPVLPAEVAKTTGEAPAPPVPSLRQIPSAPSSAVRRTTRSVSPPAIKLPSAKVLGAIAAAIVVISCAAFWYTQGVELDLISDPAGAEVTLDGKPAGRTNGQGGSLVLQHLTHGTHTLVLNHPDFDEWSQPVSLGWFHSSHALKVALPIPTFPFTVITDPAGAKIQIDGQDAGVTESNGTLVIPKVQRGRHLVTVTMSGYPPWSETVWVGSALSVRANLAAAAAAAQQEIASRLARAQSFFQQREYRSAVEECDVVLRLDPANQEAANLKSQVLQTMSILGVK